MQYTGKVDITSEIAVELLRAASFYCVLELQKRAEEFLSHEICVENVVSLLTVADECNAQDLKKNCVPYLLRHIHDVVRLPAFKEHRIQASEEVLKALSSVLGPEWEASYEKFVDAARPAAGTVPGRVKRHDDEPLQVAPVSEPREVPEYLLSPQFLLSPIPPPSNNGYTPAFATIDSPLRYNGLDDSENGLMLNGGADDSGATSPQQQQPQEESSFLKAFQNHDMVFNRPYGFSEDLSEGISEGVC